MARVALVIGTGEYGTALKPLPAAPKDAEAVAAVLNDPAMGGFDRVDKLLNPPYAEMAETIETWFRDRQKDDLALLYISGHGIKDAQLDLYFAACNTRKDREELVRSTAVAASFVRDRIGDSKAKQQVIILDCCFSGAFGDLLTKDDGTINLENLLGAEGRVVLTSSNSIQYSFEQRDGELSIYTRYLIEGIRTGAADLDEDGAISVQELHHYASRKVQEESPAMTPKSIVLKDEGYQIQIAKAPLGDPKVKYRKEVEAIVQEDGDEIDQLFSRPLLEEWQQKLGLTGAEAQTIEATVLEPIHQRHAKIKRYQEIFSRAVQKNTSFGARECKRLKQLQQVLGLLDENVELIWTAYGLDPNRPSTLPPSIPSPTPPHSSNPIEPDDLSSEKGIDYMKLRDLLKTGKWQEADQETYEVMIRAVGRKSGDLFSKEDLSNFPCEDLRTIDRLWVKYSSGKFGFSVQKQIYVECGAKLDGNYPGGEIWDRFCDRVGWKQKGKWVSYSNFTFDSTNSTDGHLPAFIRGVGFGGWWENGGYLFSRIATCRL